MLGCRGPWLLVWKGLNYTWICVQIDQKSFEVKQIFWFFFNLLRRLSIFCSQSWPSFDMNGRNIFHCLLSWNKQQTNEKHYLKRALQNLQMHPEFKLLVNSKEPVHPNIHTLWLQNPFSYLRWFAVVWKYRMWLDSLLYKSFHSNIL